MISKNILSKAILAATGVVLSATSAMAQNPNYAPGDVVLYFQQFGGSNTVALNVGAGTTFRDATANILNIANIGSLLSNGTSGFGSNWYDSGSLWWGAAGVRSNSTSTTAQVAGDPGRTLYVSAGRSALGTEGTAQSNAWTFGSAGFTTTATNNITAAVNRVETQSVLTTLVEGTGSSNFDNQNPFNISGSPTTAYGSFAGGVMGSFGASSFGTFGGVAAEGALDLYRVLATTAPVGTVVEAGQTALNGNYEGSFVINQSGDVSFIVAPVAVPEPTTMIGTLVLGCAAAAMRRRRQVAA